MYIHLQRDVADHIWQPAGDSEASVYVHKQVDAEQAGFVIDVRVKVRICSAYDLINEEP